MTSPIKPPVLTLESPPSERVARVAAMLEKMAKKSPPSRRVDQRGEISIWIDDSVRYGAMLLDVMGGSAWMSSDTYEAVTADEDANHLLFEMEDWGGGMKYLMQVDKRFAAPLNAYSPKVTPEVDELSQLERDAASLVVSVATAEGELSELQVSMFAQRLADVQARLAAFAVQVGRVEDTIDLASMALVDSL